MLSDFRWDKEKHSHSQECRDLLVNEHLVTPHPLRLSQGGRAGAGGDQPPFPVQLLSYSLENCGVGYVKLGLTITSFAN